MICKKCGAEYSDTEAICPVCGAETEETKAEEIVEVEEIEEVVEEAVETTEETDAPAVKKSKKPLWIVLVVAAVIIAIAAAIFAVASNLTFTGAKDERASVYVVTRKERNRVYAKIGDKEGQYIKSLDEDETFAKNSEFVVKNNNIYFLNDEGGLSIMNMKNGKTKVIGDDFKAGTLMLSAKGNTILYAGEDGMLYKSKRGGNAKVIAKIGNANFENGLPNYGFVEGTNDAWYAPLDTEGAVTATAYLESGEAIAEKTAGVFHVGNDDGKYNVAYIMVTKEEKIQPEPVEPEEGEEAVTPEPIINRTYALMVHEEGNEPVVLNDNYVNTDSISILRKERKGVLYIADKEELPDDENMSIGSIAPGTLYFYEFGGKKITLETGVSVALVLDDLNGGNYLYDASDRAEDETIAYMKDNKLALIRDFKPVENPKEFEFLTSSPAFYHDNTFIIYKAYNPTPVSEEEPAEGEEAKQPEKAPVKLVFSNLVDGAWSDYTVIAEDVVEYVYDEVGNKIYYTLIEGEDATKRTLYCYNVASAETVKIDDDALSFMSVTNKGKDFYYIGAFNAETQLASIKLYKGAEPIIVAENLSGCLTAEDGTPYIIAADGDSNDIYYVEGDKTSLVCENMTNIIYAR